MRNVARRTTGLLFITLLALAGPAIASADEAAAAKPAGTAPKICPICQRAGNAGAPYPEKAGNTLVRGAANTFFGWTEVIRQPAEEAKHGGNVLIGLANGVGHSVKRTVSGLGEVLTFWTPKLNEEYVQFATDCPICMGNKQAQFKPAQSTAQQTPQQGTVPVPPRMRQRVRGVFS